MPSRGCNCALARMCTRAYVGVRVKQVLACRWLGMAAVEPTLLAKMSDIMRKEVEKAVAEAPGKPQPEVCAHCDNSAGAE